MEISDFMEAVRGHLDFSSSYYSYNVDSGSRLVHELFTRRRGTRYALVIEGGVIYYSLSHDSAPLNSVKMFVGFLLPLGSGHSPSQASAFSRFVENPWAKLLREPSINVCTFVLHLFRGINHPEELRESLLQVLPLLVTEKKAFAGFVDKIHSAMRSATDRCGLGDFDLLQRQIEAAVALL